MAISIQTTNNNNNNNNNNSNQNKQKKKKIATHEKKRLKTKIDQIFRFFLSLFIDKVDNNCYRFFLDSDSLFVACVFIVNKIPSSFNIYSIK